MSAVVIRRARAWQWLRHRAEDAAPEIGVSSRRGPHHVERAWPVEGEADMEDRAMQTVGGAELAFPGPKASISNFRSEHYAATW